MAVTDHTEVYQSYTGAELAAEIAALKARRLGYLSQNAGGKSYTQDLSRCDDMLRAAVREQTRRSQSDTTAAATRGTVDFSRMS